MVDADVRSRSRVARGMGSSAQVCSRRSRFGLMLACVIGPLIGWAVPSSAVPNLAGTWMVRDGTTTEFVDVVQRNQTMSFEFTGKSYSATVSADGRIGGSMDGDMSADGLLFRAAVFSLEIGPDFFPITHTTYLSGTHCGCLDGNTVSGDGCDAECQVEPCWSCTGTRSECVLSADGEPCEAGACFAGSMCEAGTCVPGERINPCVDMDGAWLVRRQGNDLGGSPFDERYYLTVRQRGTSVLVGGRLGRIDTSTGSVGWTALYPFAWIGLCGDNTFVPVRAQFSGSVALDGQSFTVLGHDVFYGARCPIVFDFSETGVRATEPPCMPEGAPCSSGDACRVDERCFSGVCQAGSALECPSNATCDPTRGCLRRGCPGDCNSDGRVSIDELMRGTNIALEHASLETCRAFDRDLDQRLGVEELVGAVHAALVGCDQG